MISTSSKGWGHIQPIKWQGIWIVLDYNGNTGTVIGDKMYIRHQMQALFDYFPIP